MHFILNQLGDDCLPGFWECGINCDIPLRVYEVIRSARGEASVGKLVKGKQVK